MADAQPSRMRNIYMMLSTALLVLYTTLRVTVPLLRNYEYLMFSYVQVYTKARKMRDEISYTFQFSLLTGFLSALGLFVKPFFFLSQINFILSITWPLWVLTKDFWEKFLVYNSITSSQYNFGYYMSLEKKPADHAGHVLLVATVLLVSLHWAFQPSRASTKIKA